MKTYKQLQERINMARAKMGDVIKDFQQSDAPQFKGKSQEKRRQMAIAAKLSNEEVDGLDEGKWNYPKHMTKTVTTSDMDTTNAARNREERKAWRKKEKAKAHAALMKGLRKEEVEQTDEELKGNQHKIDANKNGKIDGHDFKLLRSKKKVEEEVEEIDEVSRGLLSRYLAASKEEGRKNRLSPSGASSKVTKRTQGADLAMRKSLSVVTGKKLAKVPATNEEVELEESDLKPFIVVHAKHGKYETHAASTYEAAKNAAAHWKTKKGTSGMDVHRADITHSTQHVG